MRAYGHESLSSSRGSTSTPHHLIDTATHLRICEASWGQVLDASAVVSLKLRQAIADARQSSGEAGLVHLSP